MLGLSQMSVTGEKCPSAANLHRVPPTPYPIQYSVSQQCPGCFPDLSFSVNPGAQPWLLSLSSGPLTADWKLALQASPHPLLQLPRALMLTLVHSSTCQSVLGPPSLTPQPEARPSPGPTGPPSPARSFPHSSTDRRASGSPDSPA
ncbi:unnamed protein product [Rangifer tarandus platyrhynchus]|uniref:Uncharacterized protein n=1 Tax=Rangifer tarandus platyrhynchus TaxID=3082113 RepID=A0AC60A822_RANTA